MANSTNDICFDRFINVMADLITKYADKIDLDNLPDVKMPEAETSKVSASFLRLWGKYRLNGLRVQNIEVFRYFSVKNGYTRKELRVRID